MLECFSFVGITLLLNGALQTMSTDNRRITIRDVTDDVGIPFASRKTIFTDVLDIKHEAAEIVSKLLNFEQKQLRMDTAQEMLTTFNPDMLKKVITGDESWLHDYDIEIKAQSSCETGAVGDTEKRVSEVFQGFKKTLG